MEQKIEPSSWDDLADVVDTSTKVVRIPKTSEAAGRDVFVRIRGLTPVDLLKALNFPLDEINRLVSEEAEEGAFKKAMAEHVQTFSVDDLFAMLDATVRVGLVEPDPKTGDLRKLSRDFEFLFEQIVALTIPGGDAASRARFRDDGERGSD
jgi:hypothetical protein